MQDLSRVFLSYHRADTEADAGRLGDTLKRRLGVERVFADVTDIEFGANWKRVVERSLQGSVALLLIAGPGWTLTEPLTYEVAAALDAGISIIPTLVRRANWTALTRTLPPARQSLRDLNAVALDHATWEVDVEPLMRLLEKMLAEPARARVIYKAPDPVLLLTARLNRRNLRSLLVHAADLAECLADPSVLSEAQKEADRCAPQAKAVWEMGEPDGLIYLIGNARSRLMIELIGRELLQDPGGEYVPRLLFDPTLEQEIRSRWADFDEALRGWHMNHGDGRDDPGHYRGLAKEAEDRATDRLRAQLPGLTRDATTCAQLFSLIENQVIDILDRGRLDNYWEYVVMKHFAAYPDKRYEVREEDRPRVQAMLEEFHRSYRPDRF